LRNAFPATERRNVPDKLARPPADFDAGNGLLLLEQFQMAYVANDIEKAGELFRQQLGIREFTRLEGETSGGGYIRADFAWVGTLMYELIQAQGPGSVIFSGHLPATEEFVIRHHHLGFLVQNRAQWEAVQTNATRVGLEIVSRSSSPLVDVCFVAVPACSHYLEYFFATAAGMEFFDNVSRS
jgi:hypothetical protein